MTPRSASDPEALARAMRSEPRFTGMSIQLADRFTVRVSSGAATVVMVWPEGWRKAEALVELASGGTDGPSLVVLMGSDEDFTRLGEPPGNIRLVCWTTPISMDRLAANLQHLFSLLVERHLAGSQQLLVNRYKSELDELVAISRAISSERDIDRLLDLILAKSRYVTGADAGSVYVVEGSTPDPSKKQLRFKVTQTDSVEMDFSEFTMEVSDKSIVGNSVLKKTSINIPDLYTLAPDNPWGVTHDKSFDRRMGYESHSMLTVPMLDRSSQVIGVIQLINKKRDRRALLTTADSFADQVVPFDQRSEELAVSLASQAGISLENALLYEEVRLLFEGFVRAAVGAIESRDPTTSGHSLRVARLTCALAAQVSRETEGEYADVCFSAEELKELEYAGLLHDFGKVGVRENVLTKANKLYEQHKDLLLLRFDYVRSAMEAELHRRKLELTDNLSVDEARKQFGQMDEVFERSVQELNKFVSTILEANRPTVLQSDASDALDQMAGRTYLDPSGRDHPYLAAEELECLKIPRGSLTAAERAQIESHVEHTHNFLKLIPWGRAYRNVPDIAARHHEKMDGSGYPAAMKAADIPLQARMMAIADIFDALTASDRPYKKAVPCDRALKIIREETERGHYDPELFRIFVERKIYEVVLPEEKSPD